MACRTGQRLLVRLAAAGLSLLAITGCSTASADQSPAPRVVRLVAVNFGYEPSAIEVQLGEEVRLVFENSTDLPHELFIGSEAEQLEHAAKLAAPGVDPADLDAADPAAVYVPARGAAQLVYRFDDPDDTVIGCHLAGHWESGMRARIDVRPAR